MKQGKRFSHDLEAYLDEVVYPALFKRLDTAFPAFAWRQKGDGTWEATQWPADFPLKVEHENPDRLMVYVNRPHWVKVHGHDGVRFLNLVNGGRKPDGPDFIPAVRKLCELAGVSFPERDRSPDELARLHQREARRSALEAVTARAQTVLWSPAGEAARAYLTAERGFTDDDLRELGFGFYDRAEAFREALKREGKYLQDAEAAALLWTKLEGYILIPWADASGQPLTLYGRWPEKTPPNGRPKTIALPGDGTKGSPLYYDRARKAGHTDLVAVEGVFDAALLQARGDSRVVAYVAAQFSGGQIETLVRHKVRSVIVCPDPDGGGDRGALASVSALDKAGILAYAAPRLPDGLDPDEFLLRKGLDGWKAHVSKAVSGATYRAQSIIGNVSTDSPDVDRRRVVDEVLSFETTLRGPRAGLDREDVLRLLEEKTGYSAATLADMAEGLDALRRKEKAEKDLDDALRRAQDRGDRSALDVVRDLSTDLATLQVHTVDAPPPFDVDRIRETLSRKPHGLASGLKTLDDALEVRFHAGELAALLARPAHGKTAALGRLLLNWTRAAKGDEVFVFYSFEEPEEFLTARLVSMLTAEAAEVANAGWDGWTPFEVRAFDRDPRAHAKNNTALAAAWEEVRAFEGRLQIVFRPGWTVDELVVHARALAARETLGGVLVDYWQKIPPPGGGSMTGREDRRDIALAVVGRRLKALAVDLNCPVVAGAQAGRETAKDATKIPQGKEYKDEAVQKALRSRRFTMQDAREGGIEQEADMVLGLLNFRADFREGAETPGNIPPVTRLEVGVLKNRYGPPGKWAGVAFDGRCLFLRDPAFEGEV